MAKSSPSRQSTVRNPQSAIRPARSHKRRPSRNDAPARTPPGAQSAIRNPQSAIRVGLGYDIHRLSPHHPLVLGGIEIPSPKGPLGHSDGDVVLHALTDALLGACAAGDIGEHFPDFDPRWRGAASSLFVRHAVKIVARRGLAVGNVDVTIFAEAPRLGPHKRAIARRIAVLCGIRATAVGVKAKTMEGLGPIGARRAIAAIVIAGLQRG